MPSRQHHDEFETNQFLGKELQYFSQAGFDLDRIHIKVSLVSAPHATGGWLILPSEMRPSRRCTRTPS